MAHEDINIDNELTFEKLLRSTRICIQNMVGIAIIDGGYIDNTVYKTSSQFLYESDIITTRSTIKYMFMLVSSLYNLVSKDIDLKFFNTFKTIFEMDSGICKYFFKAKKSFPLIFTKRLRLKFAYLFFKVKECLYMSKSNLTHVTLGLEMDVKKHSQKVLDTTPILLTVVKLLFYALVPFINAACMEAGLFIVKKTTYYKSKLLSLISGFKLRIRRPQRVVTDSRKRLRNLSAETPSTTFLQICKDGLRNLMNLMTPIVSVYQDVQNTVTSVTSGIKTYFSTSYRKTKILITEASSQPRSTFYAFYENLY